MLDGWMLDGWIHCAMCTVKRSNLNPYQIILNYIEFNVSISNLLN